MANLFLAIFNTLCGLYFLVTLSSATPGFIFVLFVTIIVNSIGFAGLFLWFWQTIEDKEESWVNHTLQSWRHLAIGIDILLIVGFLFRIFVVQPFLVEGNSMEPNYQNKEFILVDRVTYRFRNPKRGEVIIFRFPKDEREDYIKRIVALPGETITIENAKVLINGQLLNEDYLEPNEVTRAASNGKTYLKQTLSQNEYFVMGDNRNHSSDSRDWGTVPFHNIIGRSWFTVFPFENFGFVKNPKNNIALTFLPNLLKRSQ